MFLGVPFNIASYALLTYMVAQQAAWRRRVRLDRRGCPRLRQPHRPGPQAAEREPYEYPQLKILRKPDTIFDYTLDDFEVVGYQHHPTIKAPIAV